MKKKMKFENIVLGEKQVTVRVLYFVFNDKFGNL